MKLVKQNNLFANRVAALGTKHQKEKVIAPLFKKELAITVKVPKDLDTDKFGTFTLETKRTGDQKETAILKATAAMQLLGLDIGIASEGSFGPHPAMPFGNVNTEIVVFVDKKLGLKVFGGSIEPVAYARNIVANNLSEVMDFAKRIDFPQHGIVVRKAEKDYRDMVKGITTTTELKETAERLLGKYGVVWLETDFRAHVNQTRMKNIKKATEDLIANLHRLCPNCRLPGFHRIAPKPGLACENCGSPTDQPLYDVYSCDSCNFAQDIIYPNEKKTAYAGYCDYCNP